MSWVKLDDRFAGHPKVRKAWKRSRASIGLYTLALTYAAQHETDGVLDVDWIEDMLPAKKERDQAVDALVAAGLFDRLDDERVVIHDYLEHNESRAEAEARRERDRERKARGGRRRAPKESTPTPDGFHAESARNPDGLRVDSGSTRAPVPSRPVPSTGETALSATADVAVNPDDIDTARQSLQSADVKAVFDTWVESTGRSPGRTKLDPKRKRLIQNALKSHGLDDTLAAVRGWRLSPHHRGENDRHTVFNDLDVLLRDAKQIEKFRDLELGADAVAPAGETLAERSARINATVAKINGGGGAA